MITLCGFAVSNYFNKVKMVLLEKGVPFEEEYRKTGSKDEAVLAASPLAKVPFMRTEHGTMCESQAMLGYIEAGKRGRRVLVIERSEKVGKKILISGGGRCNFTNLNTSADNFISANPHFCKSALARYTPADFVSLIACHTFSGDSGVVSVLMPRSPNASITPLVTQGGPPIAPDSPQPLAPSGLVRQGADSSSVTWIGGMSPARGTQ